jgi:hypothetical protein
MDDLVLADVPAGRYKMLIERLILTKLKRENVSEGKAEGAGPRVVLQVALFDVADVEERYLCQGFKINALFH